MLGFAPMKRLAVLAATALIFGCGSPADRKAVPDKNPLSVRGWVEDVEGGGQGMERTPETELARRAQLFQSMNVWVENVDYVSGGVAQDGSFLLLDVPPGNVTVSFATPGVESAKLVLQNVPAGADVLIPGVMLRNGDVKVVNPKAIVVRVPASIDKTEPTGAVATIAGNQVPVIRAPLREFTNRRDYPDPGGLRTVAIYK